MGYKVSIVVPVYNTEKYLDKCLDSLVNQTLKDIEIICVNDGSTDSSLSIIEKYAEIDSRVVIVNQVNQGQSAARNSGIKIAQGEYVGFLDSDDWADLTMFEKLYTQAKDLDTDITMCSITTFNELTNEYSITDPYMTLDLFPKSFENSSFTVNETFDFIFRICVTPWNKIYRTKFLRKKNIKFVEKLNFEDNVFCIETMLKSNSMSVLKEPLVFYRVASTTSYSHSNKQDSKKMDFFKIMDLEEKLLKECGVFNKLKKYFKWHKENTLIYWNRKIKHPIVKIKYILKFCINIPSIIFYPFKQIYSSLKFAHLVNSIPSDKIILWGASIFLQKLLKKKWLNTNKIVGIIDKDTSKIGKYFEGFKIQSIDILKSTDADTIIIAVMNFPFDAKMSAKLFLKENNIDKKIKTL